MINEKDIFNENTLVVFTDGSIYTTHDGKVISSSGSIIIHGNNVMYNEPIILKESTNNIAELIAIYTGLYKTISLYFQCKNNGINIENIYLFSDSKYCIDGLTTWLSNWVKNQYDRTFINYSGQPVANQNIFQIIIKMILQNQIPINLFKTRGHLSTGFNDINKLRKYLHDNNYGILSKDLCSEDLLRLIIKYNAEVDKIAYNQLQPFKNDESSIKRLQYANMFFPIQYLGVGTVDLPIYFDIINYN